MAVAGGNSKIGILGGIGPEATGEFYNKLIKGFQERELIRSNRDFPQIIINSIPAPELIYDSVSEEELKPYLDGLKELDSFDVDFIVMVCNTIYIYYNILQKEIRTPILDLRAELKDTLIEKGIKSTFTIGTPNTIKQGLYKFKNIKSFNPKDREIKQLSKSIFCFNRGVDKQRQIQIAKRICERYLDKGAKTIILGCTELAVMLDKEDFPKINTIDVLVEATINQFILKTKQEVY